MIFLRETAKDWMRRRYGRVVAVVKFLMLESSTWKPRAPGPPCLNSGSADLTTRESHTERRAATAFAGFEFPVMTDVSMKPATYFGSVPESGSFDETSLATLPTHSSRFAPVMLTVAGEIPWSWGSTPSAPSTP